MTAVKRHKIKLREVNRHLVCRLCRGYYIDATTIAECLHSFCRSCIIKYLEKNSFCPICEVQIHKTKPYLNLRLDKALQDVVYKLVPGLYHNEMARRRKFFEGQPEIASVTTPEQRGVEERLIFSPEDSISLSLEFMDSPEPEAESVSSRSSDNGEDFPLQLGLMKVRRGDSSARKESTDSNEPGNYPKRFLLCPAVVSIRLLKKYLSMKFELSSSMEVEMMHKRVPLADHYTLMDVAYIFTWKRMAPMRLFYQICKVKNEKSPPPITEPKCLPVKPELHTVTPPPTIKVEPNIGKPAELIRVKKEVEDITAERKDTVQKTCPKLAEGKVVVKKELGENKVVVKSDMNGVFKMEVIGSKKVNLEGRAVDKNNVHRSSETKIKTDVKPPKTVRPILPSPPVLKTPKESTPKVDKFGKVPTPKVAESVKSLPKVSVDSKVPEVRANLLPVKPPVSSNGSVQVKVSEGARLVPPAPLQPKVVLQSHVSQVKVPPKCSELRMKPKVADVVQNPSIKLEERKAVPQNQNKPVPSPKPMQPIGKHALPVGLVRKSPEVKIEKPVVRPGEKLLLNPISGKLEPVPVSPEKEIPPKKPVPAKPEEKTVKSSVQQLKTFRKEKPGAAKTNSLTITTTPSKEKVVPKEEANVSIEIKSDGKCSEYDFESSSPPNRIMSLQEYTQSELYKSKYSKMNGSSMNLLDFRKQVLNGTESPDETKKEKNKMVPSLYRINQEKKPAPPKVPVKQKEESAKVINIKTPDPKKGSSPPKPIKIENKGGEYSIKSAAHEGGKTPRREADAEADAELLRLLLKRRDQVKSKAENANAKRPKTPATSPKPVKPPTPIDLSKLDPPASSPAAKIPLENLMELAKKPLDQKKDQNMLEMLISIAQKQSIEPLLKVPQYPQGSKSGGQGQTVSPSDINQALQFFQKLSSDMKMLEARTQAEQSLPPKPPNILTLQQYYLQQIEFVRMLKRQQALGGEVPAKIPKLSPTKEEKKSPTNKEETAMKSVERTISQIQEQAEIQRRMVAAQNCKNLPALLQYYSHPSSPLFRPNLSPPAGSQSPVKSSQLSPNNRKSPPQLTPEEHQQLLASQQQMFNAGLTSEMSFHQMFQQYLQQQLKMNQRKSPAGVKRPGSPVSKSNSPPEKKSPPNPPPEKISPTPSTEKKSPAPSSPVAQVSETASEATPLPPPPPPTPKPTPTPATS